MSLDLKSTVRDVVKTFFEWKPLSEELITRLKNCILVEYQLDSGLETFQDSLIHETIGSELFKRFPVRQDRTQTLVKKIILILENLGVEVRSELYNFMSWNPQDERSYKSYFFENDYLLSLAERSSFIVEGSTGLVTWSAAKILTNWLFNHSDLLRGHILELGTGLGYTGISLVKLGLVKEKLTMTDYHCSVLKELNHNVEVNFPSTDGWIRQEENKGQNNEVAFSYKGSPPTIAVQSLNWTTFSEQTAKELAPNVTIGADIVFDEDLLQDLVKTIRLCLRESKASLAVIAGEIRNEKTVDFFESLLTSSFLVFDKAMVNENPPVFVMKIFEK